MNSQEEREKLMRFLAMLPAEALDQLSQKQVDAFLLVHDIAAGLGLVLYEVGNICEAVRRVLAGEDSPANLVAFISEDKNIEEDNRGKIPEIAQEIQTKIFDPVLPILKQAGMPVKEGRVTEQKEQPPKAAPFGKGDNNPPRQPPLVRGITTPSPSLERRGGEINIPSQFQVPSSLPAPMLRQAGKLQVPLDERHLRALLRIAAGTIYTEEKLRESFEDLPQGLRQAITSVDTANAVQDIAKKYLLHVDQMGSLASETGLVLLGLTHPKNFVANLAKRLRVPNERALEIGKEISAEILSGVRDTLRHLHEKGTASPTEQPPARQNAPPPLVRGIQPTKAAPFIKKDNKPRLAESPLIKGVPPSSAVGRVVPGTPFGKGENNPPGQPPLVRGITTPSPSCPPKADPSSGGEKEGGIRTPYSPETKWNLGEDSRFKIPASPAGRQDSSTERLTREEVLRDIENPSAAAQLKTSNLQLETRVGPTGWRPPVNHETGSMKHEARRAKQETKEVEHFQTNSNDKIPTAPSPSLERRGGEKEPIANRSAPDASEEDLVEQKLSGPVSAPPTEHRYAADPYREQIE